MCGSVGLEDRRDVEKTIKTNETRETAAGLAETGEHWHGVEMSEGCHRDEAQERGRPEREHN